MANSLISRAVVCAGIVGLAISQVGQTAWAQNPKGQQPGGHLKISEVVVDFTEQSEVILIKGEDFDFGPGPLTVTLGDPDVIQAWAITCTPDYGTTPQTITCDFGSSGLPLDGDYLLTVATGNGQSQSDEYDLTIGAVGPAGAVGARGETGSQGNSGPQGTAGLTG